MILEHLSQFVEPWLPSAHITNIQGEAVSLTGLCMYSRSIVLRMRRRRSHATKFPTRHRCQKRLPLRRHPFPTTQAPTILHATTVAPTTPVACAKPKGHKNCDFYRGCLEARVACGPEGYALGFGEAYCEVFRSIEAETSDADDRAWYSAVRACFQTALRSARFSSTGPDL